MLESRPPPHVLMIYTPDGGSYSEFFATSEFRLTEAQTASEGLQHAAALLQESEQFVRGQRAREQIALHFIAMIAP